MISPDPLGPRHVGTSNVETVGASPKAVAATAVSTLLGIVLAVLNAVNSPEGAQLLGSLPATVQALILVAIPPLVIGVSTYAAAVGRVALKQPGS